jgi:hypothetical protein
MAQSVLYTVDGSNNTQIYLVGTDVATVNVTTGNDMTQGTTFDPNTFNFANNIIYTTDYNLSSNLTIPFPTSSLIFGTQVLFTLVVPSNNTYTLSFVGAYGDIIGFVNGTTLNAGRYLISLVNEGTTNGFVNVAQSISSGSGGTTLSISSAIAASNGLSIAVLFNQAISGSSPAFTVSAGTITSQTISGSTVTINMQTAIVQNASLTISGGTGVTGFAGATNYTVNTSGIGVAVQPPTALRLTNMTDTIVSLAWTASPTVGATYKVYDVGVQVTTNISITGTTAIISALASGSTHTYTVRASFGGSDSTPTSGILVGGNTVTTVTTLSNLKSINVPTNANAPLTSTLNSTNKLNITNSGNTADVDCSFSFDILWDGAFSLYSNVITIGNTSNALFAIRLDKVVIGSDKLTLVIAFNDLANSSSVTQYNALLDYNLSTISFTNIVVTYNATSKVIKTYKNGSLFQNDNTVSPNFGAYVKMGLFTNIEKLCIGGSTYDNNPASNFTIDNVLMVKKELNLTEVTELYNGGNYKYPPTLSFYNTAVLDVNFNNSTLVDNTSTSVTITGTPTYV